MGCGYSCKYGKRFTVYLIIIFLISSSSQLSPFNAQGRKLTRATSEDLQALEEDKALLRAQIGSRPPRCDRRCSSCPHCEAIQVPTNPQTNKGAVIISQSYFRSDDDHSSNYKPMSWKCKCGSLIFNP